MNTEQHPGRIGPFVEIELKIAGNILRWGVNLETREVTWPADQFALMHGFKDICEMLLDDQWMDRFIEERNATGKFPVSAPSATNADE